jgi:hypothetical protein
VEQLAGLFAAPVVDPLADVGGVEPQVSAYYLACRVRYG